MKFTLADATHDEGLRRLVREHPMPGWVRLAYTCEPTWTRAQVVLGERVQTLVGTDAQGRVAGCAVRAVRQVHLNGHPGRIGYLSGLRSLPSARGALGLSQGFHFLGRLHKDDGQVSAYLSTIIEENRSARELLTQGRAGLPAYADLGRLFTSAIPFRRRRLEKPLAAGLQILQGGQVDSRELFSFLQTEGAKRQFFPSVQAADLGSPRWRDLTQASFRVVLRDRRIVGAAAVWDQSSFRQVMVADYAQPLKLFRPLVNLAMGIRSTTRLPAPGQPLPMLHLSLTCVSQDDPEVLSALLRRIHDDWRHAGAGFLAVCQHESDPLRKVMQAFDPLTYASRLYLVHWEDGRPLLDSLERGRIPHLESGLL